LGKANKLRPSFNSRSKERGAQTI